MEEPGEQCIVVFALIVTEPVSECVYVEGMEGGGVNLQPSLPLAGSVTIYAKTTVHCSPGSSVPHSLYMVMISWGSYSM